MGGVSPFSEKRNFQQGSLSNPFDCHRNYKRSQACNGRAGVHEIGADFNTSEGRRTNASGFARALVR